MYCSVLYSTDVTHVAIRVVIPLSLLSVTICLQSGLLELSGLSADLDVLNELSCSRTLGDAAARRLQRLNHRWADVSARAEEACR